MRSPVQFFVASTLFTAALWVGCSSDPVLPFGTTGAGGSTTAGAGGATTTTSTTGMGPQAVAVGSGGAADTCIPDNGEDGGLSGVCELLGGEDCDCKECLDTAFCVPDQCVTDGVCDPTYDSCICSDCDTFHFCANPQKANCVDDGECDSFHEGCTCPDCGKKADCQDNLMACNGGKLDGTCEESETCTCADCFGTPKCVPCNVNGTCNTYDPCSCVDCINGDYCTNPDNCTNDGVCDILLEGCVCDDCMSIIQCTNPDPVGAGGGGMGGMGGAGGMGGMN